MKREQGASIISAVAQELSSMLGADAILMPPSTLITFGIATGLAMGVDTPLLLDTVKFDDEDRKLGIHDLLAGAVTRLGTEEPELVEFVTTGALALDAEVGEHEHPHEVRTRLVIDG